MTATVWTQSKIKKPVGGRTRTVTALLSDAAPGIALEKGQWIDLASAKGKTQLIPQEGYRAIVLNSGAICGPALADLDKASAYAVAVSKLTDWSTAGTDVPGPLYAKLMRLWYPAAGTKLTAAMKRKLAKLEAEPEDTAHA